MSRFVIACAVIAALSLRGEPAAKPVKANYPLAARWSSGKVGKMILDIYNKNWSEKHHGVREVTDKDGKVTFQYTIDKNSDIARNLKGHLLLATGDIDDNVHPANTIRLVDALIKANKRFDMIVLPGRRHAYGASAEYFSWVRADYFAKHLLGDYDQNVDMWEVNNERPQSGDRRRGGAQQQQGQRTGDTETQQ